MSYIFVGVCSKDVTVATILDSQSRIKDMMKYFKVEQAVWERLEGWPAKALSTMDRVTLVRSVLSSLLVYLLSNSVLPRAYLLRVEWLF